MATEIVVRLQAHPSRSHLWPKLISDCAPLPVEVSVHSAEPPNPWEGYQRALQSGLDAPTNPTHVLVLQEDVVVCRNFAAVVQQIAEAKPDTPVSLFLSWLPQPNVRVMREGMRLGQRYVQARPAKFCPVLAVLWPLPAIERFLAWHPTDKLPGSPGPVRSDDAVLGHWIRRQQEVVWITNPSLVDHPDTEPSIWKRRAEVWGAEKNRSALNYIGDADPLSYDWSSQR